MSQPTPLKSLKIYTQDGNEVLKVYSITREKYNLIMDCKVLDTMRMDVIVTPDEVFDNLNMLVKAVLPYVFLLLWLAMKRSFRSRSRKN
jgi:hypothetical protein